MKYLIYITTGLLLLIISIYAAGINLWQLGYSVIILFKGSLLFLSFTLGILFLVLGILELKN